MLLRQERNAPLRKEARNSTRKLIAALVYLKFKKHYLNEGTQVETAENFDVKTKALSKLLSGCKYLGGKDKKTMGKRKTPPEGGKYRKTSNPQLQPSHQMRRMMTAKMRKDREHLQSTSSH